MIIALGISTFVILIAMTVILSSTSYMSDSREALAAEQEAMEAVVKVTNFLVQGIDIEQRAARAWGTGSYLENYDGTNGFTGTIDTVAGFLREFGRMESRIRPSAIFYNRPSPTSSGVIFLIRGTAGAAMTPTYRQIYIDRVVEFSLNNFTVVRNNRLSSADVRITIRKFQRNAPIQWRWCPPANGADPSCQTTIPFRDITRTMKVSFRNNDLWPLDPANQSGIFGNIYFFQPTLNMRVWR